MRNLTLRCLVVLVASSLASGCTGGTADGSCSTPLDCDDGDACTLDVCNASSTCEFPADPDGPSDCFADSP
jgi:hypothetical protein